MRFPLLALCLTACASPLFAQTTGTANAPSLLALQNEVTQVVARAKPSVVTISVWKPASAASQDEETAPDARPSAPDPDPSAPRLGLGTGWVFRSDGLILTNYHVVSAATSIHVTFGADTISFNLLQNIGIPARVVGYDADADLAVLKIDRANLPTLELADSDAAQVGQWTIVIGQSLLLGRSVTLGVLSGKDRVDLDNTAASVHYLYLQTDAALKEGNSGGPLLDLNGHVLGLNTAAVSGETNVGFSLPSNTIGALLPYLVAGKRVRHADIGFTGERLTPEAAHELGLEGGFIVGSLAQKNGVDIGPAKEAGLHKGDIILGVDSKPVPLAPGLRFLVGTHTPGDKISLDIARIDFAGTSNVQKFKVSLVLGDSALLKGEAAPALIAPEVRVVGSGLSVVDASTLDAAHKSRYSLKGTESGAVISGIVPLSSADEAGLSAGVRIVRAHQNGRWTEISSAASWKAFETSATPGARLLLQLRGITDDDTFRVLILPTP